MMVYIKWCGRRGRALDKAKTIIAVMELPRKAPGLKLAMILLAAYAAVWIALEGNLLRVTALGWGTALVAQGAIYERLLGGRQVSLVLWFGVAAALGVIVGFSSAVLTLLFMALKSGLHAHGPEFSPAQIDWVVEQVPWWSSAGLLAGVGVALIAVAAWRIEEGGQATGDGVRPTADD